MCKTMCECQKEIANLKERLAMASEGQNDYKNRVDEAVGVIDELGFYDGGHHKQYCLVEVAKVLLREKYDEWVDENWEEEGIAP